jgi:RNA polymerase sigma factor (sigma-70 family)
LLKSAVEGDQDAWRGLVDGLSPLVWSVVRGHRLSEADAHEVYQIAWFRFAQHLGRIREPEKAGSWLAATARHECLKVLRSMRRWTPTDDPQVLDRPCDSCSPEQKVLEAEAEAEQADRHRTVWEEFDREVSAALGIAVGSIGPIRQRCLRRLRKRLSDRGVL